MALQELTRFSAMMRRRGAYARIHEYDVSFENLPVPYPKNLEHLHIRCESFSLPGGNISTTPDNIRLGPIREHAIGMTFGTVTGVFLCDSELTEKQFFTDWQRYAIDEKWEPRYFNDYASASIKVTVHNDSGEKTHSVKLLNCFPKTVTPMALASAEEGLLRVSVEFSYWTWENN